MLVLTKPLPLSQAADAEPGPLLADTAAHHPGGGQLLPDARLHDLQRIPVHRSGSRCRHRVLPVQLEEGGGCRHHRALSLVSIVSGGHVKCALPCYPKC